MIRKGLHSKDGINPDAVIAHLVENCTRFADAGEKLWSSWYLVKLFGFQIATLAHTHDMSVSTISRKLKALDQKLEGPHLTNSSPPPVVTLVYTVGHLTWDLLRVSLHYGEQGDQLPHARALCQAMRRHDPRTAIDLMHMERALIALHVHMRGADEDLLSEADALAREAGEAPALNLEHPLLADVILTVAHQNHEVDTWARLLERIEDYGKMNPIFHVYAMERVQGWEQALALAQNRYARHLHAGKPLSLVFRVAEYLWKAGHPRKSQHLLKTLDSRGLSPRDRAALEDWLIACKVRYNDPHVPMPQRKGMI